MEGGDRARCASCTDGARMRKPACGSNTTKRAIGPLTNVTMLSCRLDTTTHLASARQGPSPPRAKITTTRANRMSHDWFAQQPGDHQASTMRAPQSSCQLVTHVASQSFTSTSIDANIVEVAKTHRQSPRSSKRERVTQTGTARGPRNHRASIEQALRNHRTRIDRASHYHR